MGETRQGRILVIEDSAMQQRLLRMALEGQGHEVVSAMDGAEGKRILEEDRDFSIILLDLVMPDLDGVSFLRWLRGEAVVQTPVVVLSSKDENVLSSVDHLGDTSYLRKPVDLDRLDFWIQDALAA